MASDDDLVEELLQLFENWDLDHAEGWSSANEQETAFRELVHATLDLVRPRLRQMPEFGEIVTTPLKEEVG